MDIHRGVFARLPGLSDLSIRTAGASGTVLSEGKLPGLSVQIAESLRDERVGRARQSGSQGL